MSTHIGAEPGQVAPYVLMPGDPLRARWIAETFLQDATCYTEVRGMLGFTGTYRGEPVSVQGSGMGQPSLAIYATGLMVEYDVRSIVRVGSCGALTDDLRLRDLVIASGACTDSSMNQLRFGGLDYAPVADFELLRAAHDAATSHPTEARVRVGLLMSSDSFYHPRPELTARLVEHGVLGVEMEASALYTLAAGHRRRALAVHGLGPHRDRRADLGRGAAGDLRRHGGDRPRRDARGRLRRGPPHSSPASNASRSSRPGSPPGSTRSPLRT